MGAGGLGCPAAMYLAGAGVGTLGIIDGDTVEASNLHRQILHRTKYVGQFKVDSAIKYLQECVIPFSIQLFALLIEILMKLIRLNPHPTYIPYRKRLTPQEAPDIFDKYEIILDCTDNPATRYLISDTAVLLGKPVVSASALRTEGQLMILNYPPKPRGNTSGGSCYRCVFPKPPPPDSVVSCADGGIIGPVVGLMGVMQALETIKIITSQSTTDVGEQTIVPSLHLFSAYSTPPFRNVRLRKRRANCSVCSATATITLETLRNASTDYVQFCGLSKTPSLLDAHERITPVEYRETYSKVSRDQASEIPVLIDVREKVQYEICALPNSINIPVSHILSSLQTTDAQNLGDGDGNSPPWLPASVLDSGSPLYVLCRQGNDSQVVVKKLKNMGIDRNGKRIITDIRGGLVAWRNDIDPDFPDY